MAKRTLSTMQKQAIGGGAVGVLALLALLYFFTRTTRGKVILSKVPVLNKIGTGKRASTMTLPTADGGEVIVAEDAGTGNPTGTGATIDDIVGNPNTQAAQASENFTYSLFNEAVRPLNFR